MIRHLPAEASTHVSVRGPGNWTQDTELLAQLVERVTALINVTGSAHSKKGKWKRINIEVRRPEWLTSLPKPPRRMSTPDEVAAFAKRTGGTIRYQPRKE